MCFEDYIQHTTSFLILVLDPRCKLVWYKATGWPKEWIDHSRKAITELYKTHYKPKTATEDECKTYLSESVVDPDLLDKEKTGIDGVLGWWKVCVKDLDPFQLVFEIYFLQFVVTDTPKGISCTR